MGNLIVFQTRIAKLTVPQRAIYSLLTDAVEKAYPITDSKLSELFLSCHKNKAWNPWANRIEVEGEETTWQGGYRSLEEQEIRSRAKAWLKCAIGQLVIKGYLSVMPRFELSEVDEDRIIPQIQAC